MRRIPSDIKADHYHDDEVHIRQILEASGLVLKGGMDLAAATIRGLILTVSHQGEIDELYPQVLEMLVQGACREFFDEIEKLPSGGFLKDSELEGTNQCAGVML